MLIHPMAGHWFRIPYSRNAFLRLLAERGATLDTLTVDEGEQAMRLFLEEYRPQHAEADTLTSSTRTARGHRERVLARRMQRHGHPAWTLRLVFELDDDGAVTARRLEQSEGRRSVEQPHP